MSHQKIMDSVHIHGIFNTIKNKFHIFEAYGIFANFTIHLYKVEANKIHVLSKDMSFMPAGEVIELWQGITLGDFVQGLLTAHRDSASGRVADYSFRVEVTIPEEAKELFTKLKHSEPSVMTAYQTSIFPIVI